MAPTQNSSARRLAVRWGAKFIVLDPKSISAIMDKDHVVAQKLSPEQFIRVHRSALINVDFLKELEREGDRKYVALLKDQFQTRSPVGREPLRTKVASGD